MTALPVFFTGLAEEDIDQIEDYISPRPQMASSIIANA